MNSFKESRETRKKEIGNSHVGFLGELDLGLLRSLGHHVLVLDSHDSSSPGPSVAFVLIELALEVLGQHLQVLEVLLLDFGQGEAGGGLLVDQLPESRLPLDEAVGDPLLPAEGGEEDHEFDGVDVVSHNHELGLAEFDEFGDVVETELDVDGLGSLLGLVVLLAFVGFGLLQESRLLVLLGLGTVLRK